MSFTKRDKFKFVKEGSIVYMPSNQLIHLKNTSNKDLLKFVEGNITYFVLHRILQNDCTDIFYNNKSVIICYSNPPYPIWVWCKDANEKSDILSIANCIKANYPLEENYNVIMSYDVLEQLKKYDRYFENVSFKMELFSYQLRGLNEINYVCDGRATLAKIEDLNIIASMFKDMYYEMEGFIFDIEECKEKARNLIMFNQLYAWKNKSNEIVALTSKKIEGNYGSIASVYTVPKERRKGYAINLVHTVSKELLANNITPILYTNGNYIASNECYKKIGFEQIGRICNIKR